MVGAIAERDKYPELTDEDLNPERCDTNRKRSRAISARAKLREPLQAKIDEAVERLEAYDREATVSAPSLESRGGALGEPAFSPARGGRGRRWSRRRSLRLGSRSRSTVVLAPRRLSPDGEDS